MNKHNILGDEVPDYVPMPGLSELYNSASELNQEAIDGLCPSYSKLHKQSEFRYSDEAFIGQGALKRVYKTFDNQTQRWVAFARLRLDRGPDFFDHFVNEAWRIASLNHPNIIKVFDVGLDESERPYFTMDLKRNRTLKDFRDHTSSQDLNQLIPVFVKICDAIAYAHTKGVVHLDLKPHNIQCNTYGEVLVCDWGLAKSLDTEPLEEVFCDAYEETIDNATLIGQVKGSLGYISPEQLNGESPKGVTSDIYSLGCILHFILTGEAPYTGRPKDIIEATQASQIQPLQARFPDYKIPASLEAVVLKATKLDPAERYATVESLQHDIQNYLGGYSTEAEEPGFVREATLFYSRNRTPVTISMFSIVAIFVLSGFFIRHIEQQHFQTEIERNRADQLGVNLKNMLSKHSSLIQEAKNSKKKVANDFAATAGKIKNLGIFARPGTTVDESKKLANLALELDETCPLGKTQLFSLNCLQLNYKEALSTIDQMEEPLQGHYATFAQLAQAFPNYEFSKDVRPSIDQLVELLKVASQVSDQLGPHLHRILVYDHARRGRSTDYDKVLEAFLRYQYGGLENVSLSYDAPSQSLEIWTDSNLILLGYNGTYSYLDLLKIKELAAISDKPFNISQLHNSSIETLDLSECASIVHTGRKVSLPHLNTIIIKEGFEGQKNLRNWIVTDRELAIHSEGSTNRIILIP